MQVAYALLLTAAPGSGGVTLEAVAATKRGLPSDAIFEDRWLSEGDARQILFVAADDGGLFRWRADAEAAVRHLPVDVNIIPDDIAWTRKKLLTADMDSTMINEETMEELADILGCRAEVERLTDLAMTGAIEYAPSLRARVALLAGLSVAQVEDIARRRLSPMAGAETLVATMRANGAATALVTSGFSLMAKPVAERIGFDTCQANTLEIDNGRLTGRLVEPLLGAPEKRQALHRLASAAGLDPVLTIAVGDGTNDIEMLQASGLAVAYRAKPRVEAAVRALPHGAIICHSDLTALLYLQGYRREEFVV